MGGVAGYPHVFINQVFNIMEEFDVIHFFWREDVQHILNPEAVYRAATEFSVQPEALFDRMSRPVITSSVYDHLFLEPEHFQWRERAFNYMDGYSVASNLLDGIYRDIDLFPDPISVIPDGVDQQRFVPKALDRLSENDRPLRVGWVGNSQWGAHTGRDPKGVKTILDPALERLRSDGVAVMPHYADASVRRRNREEMEEYYSEIDVLVCASEIEGTPNPVLEAMASGVPVVSTRVGIVPEALGPKQNDFILPQRSVEAMADALRRLASDRSQLRKLSDENLKQVKKWSWAETTKGWPAFWAEAARRQQEGNRVPLKRHLLRERYAGWYAENVKFRDAIRPAFGAARMKRAKQKLHMKAVDWIYRTPERAAWVNRLRGRR